jgi:hypothetical protein
VSAELLQQIQTLQFSDRQKAEALLADFIRRMFPLDVLRVELRPQAVSLNSFNGFLTLVDGGRLFFKTHTEQDNVIDEYYNARMLAEAGYHVIQPLYSSTEAGQHLLIYEVIDDPSVFDLAWAIEQGEDTVSLNALTAAQNRADDDLMRCYRESLADQSAEEAAQAPIHQLFYHRLTGGRLDRFYTGTDIALPDGVHKMDELRRVQWTINGQVYDETLGDLIDRAIRLLHPAQAGPSIIGHGDAHNGNVFFRHQSEGLLYFDPAFAGRHHPLLDLTKPLFHNIFAMWMYFPQVKQATTPISLLWEGQRVGVQYEYHLPPLRHMFLRSKVDRVLVPLVAALREQNRLRDDWRAYLKAALFCCPFLTLNLADGGRFPPEISLLGLAMAVEMGAESQGKRSLIDRTLDIP